MNSIVPQSSNAHKARTIIASDSLDADFNSGNQRNQKQRKIVNPWMIRDLFFHIFPYMSLCPTDVFIMRRISSFHRDELSFQVLLSSNKNGVWNVYLGCKSGRLKKLLEAVFCTNLQGVAAWSCQLLNGLNQNVWFETSKVTGGMKLNKMDIPIYICTISSTVNENDIFAHDVQQKESNMIQHGSAMHQVFSPMFTALTKTILGLEKLAVKGYTPLNSSNGTHLSKLAKDYGIPQKELFHLRDEYAVARNLYDDDEPVFTPNEDGRHEMIATLIKTGNIDVCRAIIDVVGGANGSKVEFNGFLAELVVQICLLHGRVDLIKKYRHIWSCVTNPIEILLMILTRPVKNRHDVLSILKMLWYLCQSYKYCCWLAVNVEMSAIGSTYDVFRQLKVLLRTHICGPLHGFEQYFHLDATNNTSNLQLQTRYIQALQCLFAYGKYMYSSGDDNSMLVDANYQDREAMQVIWDTMMGLHNVDDNELIDTVRYPLENDDWAAECSERQVDPIEIVFPHYDQPADLFFSLLDMKNAYRW